MTNAPERIWIEDEFGDGDDDRWTYGTWDVRNYAGYDVEYVRADIVQALTAERDHAGEMVAKADTQVGQALADRLQATAERDRLREALEFYAIEENYKWYSAVDPCGCCSSWYEPKIHINGDDSGQIARAALKGETP